MIRGAQTLSAKSRWEHGSDFHFVADYGNEDADWPWSGYSHVLYSSGRHAAVALLRELRARRGIRRIWVPSYGCQEVYEAYGRAGVELKSYESSPIDEPRCPPVLCGDIVLDINTFGLRASGLAVSDDVVCLEDHSHDPESVWARTSRADYCFASLRKAYPIGDGAVLWSPKRLPLPRRPRSSVEHDVVVAQRISAMCLKTEYLKGAPIPKALFRELARAAERGIAESPVSPMSPLAAALLRQVPNAKWRRQRKLNFNAFDQAIRGGAVDVLRPKANATAFCIPLVLPNRVIRERLRRRLVEANVYPAVLWDLRKPFVRVSKRDRDLSSRVLCLHCDSRYRRVDMERVATLVHAALVQ